MFCKVIWINYIDIVSIEQQKGFYMTSRGKLNKVDFGSTSSDYARYRLGFPESFYKRLKVCDIGLPGQKVLDLATGTGTIARSMARQGCEVTGLDISGEQIDEAKKLDLNARVRIEYQLAQAEDTKLPEHSFDIIIAGQCWHWFDSEKVVSEVVRLLKADGRLVIAHYDWLLKPGNVVEATESLILKHNPSWQLSGGNGLYPQWLELLKEYDFREVIQFNFDEPAIYSHESWRGRIRANSGVGAALSAEATDYFDNELKALLQVQYPADPLEVPHMVYCVVGQRPLRP